MIRLGTVIGAIVMAVGLSGCSSNKSAEDNPTPPPAYTPKPVATIPPEQMNAYRAMAGMTPQQKAQYVQEHPGTTATLPPSPPRRD